MNAALALGATDPKAGPGFSMLLFPAPLHFEKKKTSRWARSFVSDYHFLGGRQQWGGAARLPFCPPYVVSWEHQAAGLENDDPGGHFFCSPMEPPCSDAVAGSTSCREGIAGGGGAAAFVPCLCVVLLGDSAWPRWETG